MTWLWLNVGLLGAFLLAMRGRVRNSSRADRIALLGLSLVFVVLARTVAWFGSGPHWARELGAIAVLVFGLFVTGWTLARSVNTREGSKRKERLREQYRALLNAHSATIHDDEVRAAWEIVEHAVEQGRLATADEVTRAVSELRNDGGVRLGEELGIDAANDDVACGRLVAWLGPQRYECDSATLIRELERWAERLQSRAGLTNGEPATP